MPFLCGKILNSVGQVPPDELFVEDNKLLFFNLSDWQKSLIHRRLGFPPGRNVKLGMFREFKPFKKYRNFSNVGWGFHPDSSCGSDNNLK